MLIQNPNVSLKSGGLSPRARLLLFFSQTRRLCRNLCVYRLVEYHCCRRECFHCLDCESSFGVPAKPSRPFQHHVYGISRIFLRTHRVLLSRMCDCKSGRGREQNRRNQNEIVVHGRQGGCVLHILHGLGRQAIQGLLASSLFHQQN